MVGIRRIGLVFVILVIGICLGSLGVKTALLIVTPLFFLWFMVWDERSYRRHTRKQHYQSDRAYSYRR
ncbi:hypothetical protein I6N95_24335 [Vagococcus sp. BWB3-3]|uniref:Uncharacterized protein n=1 Tax=Vagococcus allomyrinae TaxID=2794353 RepID=A0A940SZ77_9ENTE|nr:hypothetical protein [Vagococcus allomyrinae]MBP1044143.1 hypothetical protein [Vagococcus allomyrinae]